MSVEFHLHGVYRGISRKKEFVPGIFFGKEDFLVRFIRNVRFQIIQGWIKYTSYSGDFVPSPPTNFSNRISLLSMINKGSSRFSYFLATPPLLSFENPNYFCEWGR